MLNNLETLVPSSVMVFFFLIKASMDQKTDVYEFTYSDGYKKRFNEFDSDSEEEP